MCKITVKSHEKKPIIIETCNIKNIFWESVKMLKVQLRFKKIFEGNIKSLGE